MTAQRVLRKRTKGWRMPENTIYVGRGSKWGNPFRVVREGGFMWVEPGGARVADREGNMADMRAEAVDLFELMIHPAGTDKTYPLSPEIRHELSGKNLACWCPLNHPCHADVLLELANTGGA